MLDKHIAEYGQQAAQTLSQAGIKLTPVADSPVGKLIGCMQRAENVTTLPPGLVDNSLVAALVSLRSAGMNSAAQMDAHGILFDRYVQDITSQVSGYLSFCANVFNPLAVELGTRLSTHLSRLDETERFATNILEVKLPAPLCNHEFYEEIQAYVGRDFVNVRFPFSMPALSSVEIMQQMKTGNIELDNEIAAWASTVAPSDLERYWASAFNPSSVQGVDFNQLSNTFAPEVIDVVLTVYLCARNLRENPPADVKVSLSVFESQMDDLLMQSAVRMLTRVETFISQEKAGLLWLGYSKKNILVHAGLYNQWKEQGGNDTILYGNALQQRPYETIEDILSSSGKLLRAWESYNTMLAGLNDRTRLEKARAILRETATALVDQSPDQCWARFKADSVSDTSTTYYTDFIKKLDTIVDQTTLEDYTPTQVWYLAIKVFSQAVFGDLKFVEEITSGVSRAMKNNPQLQPRQARLLSIIDYMGKYLASQIVTKR